MNAPGMMALLVVLLVGGVAVLASPYITDELTHENQLQVEGWPSGDEVRYGNAVALRMFYEDDAGERILDGTIGWECKDSDGGVRSSGQFPSSRFVTNSWEALSPFRSGDRPGTYTMTIRTYDAQGELDLTWERELTMLYSYDTGLSVQLVPSDGRVAYGNGLTVAADFHTEAGANIGDRLITYRLVREGAPNTILADGVGYSKQAVTLYNMNYVARGTYVLQVFAIFTDSLQDNGVYEPQYQEIPVVVY